MHSYLQGHPALLLAVRQLEHLGADKFELYFRRKTSTSIEAKDREIDSLSRAEDVGLAIRLIKDGRLGFSYTTSLAEQAIDRAIRSAAEVAAQMPEDPYVDLFSFSQFVYPAVDHYDSVGLKAPIQQKIELAKELEARTREADKRITGIRKAALSETAYEVHLVDSNGEHIQHQGTLFATSVTCKAEQDGESQIGSDFAFSNYLEGLEVDGVARQAAEWATELLGAKQAPTQVCPAIFRNSVVSNLIGFLSSSFSAEEIDKGRSMLAGKHGERVFSEQVTLVDDGLMAGGYATSPFDGEGVPASLTTLVDGGFVSGALYDGYYARKHGKAPTGSAVRGIQGPPSIGISNLAMKNGKKPLSKLYEGLPKGILITNLMGVHTANPVTGDFSLGASGILIENGKLTRPVRGFAVAGNVLEVLRRVTDVASDLRFFGNVGAPSVRVSEISIGGV